MNIERSKLIYRTLSIGLPAIVSLGLILIIIFAGFSLLKSDSTIVRVSYGSLLVMLVFQSTYLALSGYQNYKNEDDCLALFKEDSNAMKESSHERKTININKSDVFRALFSIGISILTYLSLNWWLPKTFDELIVNEFVDNGVFIALSLQVLSTLLLSASDDKLFERWQSLLERNTLSIRSASFFMLGLSLGILLFCTEHFEF